MGEPKVLNRISKISKNHLLGKEIFVKPTTMETTYNVEDVDLLKKKLIIIIF